MNRSLPWLPTILALTANSPFWCDTGCASYRAQLWGRWPTAGMPPVLAGRAEYEALVRTLIGSGGIRDATKLYWDVRPSARYPTIEFRITDACTSVDEVVQRILVDGNGALRQRRALASSGGFTGVLDAITTRAA